MPYAAPKLTLVVDRTLYRDRPDLEPLSLVDEAILGGVGLVQMRPRSEDYLGDYAIAQRLREITIDRIPLIVTDDLDLAEKCNADGALLTPARPYRPSDARDYLRVNDGLVGCYVTSVAEAARAERGGADYVQVGPVFGDVSADGEDGLSLLRKVRDAIHLPVIAFGGVTTADLAREAVAAGANGVAVSDVILTAPDPRQAAADFAAALA